MSSTAKSQRQVIGRMVDGELHVIAEIVPFVSSRLGPDVSCEINRERDNEYRSVADAFASLNCGNEKGGAA